MRRWRHDDAFGRFEMCEWKPAPGSRLDGIVERIWHFDGSTADARERVFPDVTLELIVQLESAYRPVVDGRAGESFPLACIEGLRLTPATIEAPRRRARVMGLRFTPPAARALLRVPLGEVTGRTVDLGSVLGPAATRLAERCGATSDGGACIAAARDWIEFRMERAAPDRVAAWCMESIVACGGRVRLGELADAAGLSPAHLVRRFQTHAGVTPKRFARLARFRRTLDALGSGASLADIVYAGGYYDHSHLDADFRAHAGLSPTAFLRAARFPQSLSLSLAAP